jgi:hypothetical protein
VSKLDLVRERQELYKPPVREPVLVTVPEMAFLTVDGTGDPKTAPEYSQALEALYAVSTGAKFKVKRGPGGVDYKVMPLEGLWWSDDMTAFDRGEGRTGRGEGRTGRGEGRTGSGR